MDTENIGKFLLKLRRENSLTQKDIAKLCNISAQAVSKWERGESIPDIEILERLSILYKISINEIIGGEKKEVFLDIEKRRNIINVTAASLVFIAYLFNFAYDGGSHIYSLTYKGYELIFNGIGGVIVYLTWFVLIILISHLIIRIYIVTKVIKETENIKRYLTISMIGVIIISVFNIFIPVFYAFPQFIIILAMIVQLSFSNFNKVLNEMKNDHKEKKESYKNIDFKEEVFSNQKDKFLIKLSKISVVLGILIYTFATIFLVVMTIIMFNDVGFDRGYFITSLGFFIVFSVLCYNLFRFYKFIGTIRTKSLLFNIGLLTIPFPIIMLIANGYVMPIGIAGIITFLFLIVLILIPSITFYSSFKITKQN